MVKKYKAKIIKVKKISDSVKNLEIDLREKFNFTAGQFVNLTFKNNEQTIRRPYSICSKPNSSSKIELCIKLVKDGKATPKIFTLKKGDDVEIMGPLGLFKYKDTLKPKLTFIGTGTGIAPLRSIILDLLENKSIEKEITLVFGCRYENEILFNKEFSELEKKHPNFRFIRIISKPTTEWNGRKGHIQDNFDILDINNSDFYLCGLPIMVLDVVKKLKEKGANEEQINYEKYG